MCITAVHKLNIYVSPFQSIFFILTFLKINKITSDAIKGGFGY